MEPDALEWRVPTTEQLAEVADVESDADRIAALAKALGVVYPGADGRTAIHVEFLFTNMAYAVEAGFSSQQTHEFLSMTENVLQGSILAPLSEGAPCLSQHDSFALFKREVLSRSTDAAGGPGAFEMSAIAQMTDFVARSFYRYYRAYALTFAHVQPVKTAQRLLQVELPLTFPPLSDATQVPFVPPPDDR